MNNYTMHLATSIVAGRHAIIIATPHSVDYITPLATLVAALMGALAGAFGSYKLSARSEEKKKRANEVAAGNYAIFTIMRQWNELWQIQQEIIEPFRLHPCKSIALPSTLPSDFGHLKFDFDSLSFLLETKHRGCILELYLAESRFQAAFRILNERSKLHMDIVQPLLEKAGITAGNNYITRNPEDFIKDTLGDRVAVTLAKLTDGVIEHVDRTLPFLKETSDKLHAALKELYPGKKFINFVPSDKAET